jgi:hypothetical protein
MCQHLTIRLYGNLKLRNDSDKCRGYNDFVYTCTVARTAVAMQWARDGRIYKTVSQQRLRKHVPVARQLQQFDYNNGNGVFSMWSVPRGYKKEK